MFSIFSELETLEEKEREGWFVYVDLYIWRQIVSCCAIANDVRKVKARYTKIYDKIY